MQPELPPSPQPPAAPTPPPSATCANCGAPLYGKYCYACGQPAQGLVRHFGSVLSDVADSVLNIDERLFRSIGPLYLQPGKLTLDYFAGKRARYLTPFRMVFFLAILAFFSIQLTLRAGFDQVAPVTVKTPAVAGVSLRFSSVPQTSSRDTHFDDGNITWNDKVQWNRQAKPLAFGWLPAFGNNWVNDLIENARVNLHGMNSGNADEAKAATRRMSLGMFAVAPTVLFVLLPIFALLLKLFYLFKRRLYMEHLIVAMHSHAFLMLSMLVLVLLGLLRSLLQPHAAWLAVPFDLLVAAARIWIFVYLIVMQKRVYRQGWLMTTVKFGCIGCCYAILVVFGMAFAALVSLTGA